MGIVLLFFWALVVLYFVMLAAAALRLHERFKLTGRALLSYLLPILVLIAGSSLAAMVSGWISEYLGRTLTRGI